MLLLLSLVALAVAQTATTPSPQALAECKKKAEAVALSTADVAWRANQTMKACVGGDWLAIFYKSDRPTYDAWVLREQAKLGLGEILTHAALRRCLGEFLSDSGSRRNLQFLTEVDRFKSTTQNGPRTQLACEIRTAYLVQGAPKYIPDITPASVAGIEQGLQGKCAALPVIPEVATTLFDNAAKEVRALMSPTALEKFRKSDEYLQCRGKSLVEDEIRSFTAILDAFCTEERNAYPKRAADGQEKVHQLIRGYWTDACLRDPAFAIPK